MKAFLQDLRGRQASFTLNHEKGKFEENSVCRDNIIPAVQSASAAWASAGIILT